MISNMHSLCKTSEDSLIFIKSRVLLSIFITKGGKKNQKEASFPASKIGQTIQQKSAVEDRRKDINL